MKKLNWILFVAFFTTFILLFQPIASTKVELSGWKHTYKVGDYIYVEAYGNVITNNKYIVKEATVEVIVYDENNQALKTFDLKVRERGIEFKDFFRSEYSPEQVIIKISDVHFDYITDLIISIVSLFFAVYLFPPFNNLDRLKYKTDSISLV